jgi:putative peptidoglycan lipid II flippase
MSLVKSSATIGFFTLLSRITGFVRDVIMANMIGASWLSDAFFVAFKLPNFFRRLFAEGALNVAFIPSFASILTSEGRDAAMRFASEVMSVLLLALLALNAIFIVFMPWILPVFAPGFTDTPEKFDLTVTLAQITFPYILFISLVSLLSGVLNSMNKFAAPAANPILLNLCMIMGMVFLANRTETPAHALAISVFVAGIVQLGWLIAICRNHAMLPSVVAPKITPKVKTMLLLMAPAALGSGVQQLNLLIDIIIASHIPDAVSYLYYADRITELPIGMIGVAIGTAMLPMMSRQIREGNKAAAQNSMNRGIELVMLFGFPATAALLALAEPVIRVLYVHGAFSEQDMVATYLALMAFTVGLPAFLLVKVFAPGFFANHDTKTPFKIAALCVVVNLVLNLTLSIWLAHVGMALATSIASWVNTILMAHILYKRGIFVPDATLKRRLIRMAIATKIMVLVVILVNALLGAFYLEDMATRTLALSVVILIGMIVYGVSAWSFNALDKVQIKNLFKRARSNQV